MKPTLELSLTKRSGEELHFFLLKVWVNCSLEVKMCRHKTFLLPHFSSPAHHPSLISREKSCRVCEILLATLLEVLHLTPAHKKVIDVDYL